MKIAVIGTGITGNVAAYHLSKTHDVTVFEANDYVGGHTHTHNIHHQQKNYQVDSGFIVFNHKTYPNFIHLLTELGVETQPSHMSFSVKCEHTGLEYNGTTLNSLFAQRRNLLRPKFYSMIKDIIRFNKESITILEQQDQSLSLGEYLQRNNYSHEFINHYIIPMGSAVWSADPEIMYQFPAHYFIRFFHNHGMLSVSDRPTWHVIKGGSNSYVKKLIAPFEKNIRLNTPVKCIQRFPTHVEIDSDEFGREKFDYLFIATHSDQALRMLDDITLMEHAVLNAIPYQVNDAVLHTDHTVLPKRKLAWAAWNYHILKQKQDRVALTYNMNILQSLNAPVQFCVTLNHTAAIDEQKIIKQIRYDHPVFTPDGVAAQHKQHEINGPKRTFFCGAYWRFGFHEDGVVSALNALKHFEDKTSDQQSHLSRAS